MANRTFTQFSYSLYGKVVSLFATIKCGAAGAPTLQQWNPVTRVFAAAPTGGSRGIKSISRTSTGLFVITLQDAYNELIDIDATFDTTLISAQAAPAAPEVYIYGSGPTASVNDSINLTTGGTFTLATMNNSSAATDPASGEFLKLCVVLSDSAAF